MVDTVVIGGGLVGLATAYHLTREGASVVLVEKEDTLTAHQSGHNSGVIHSGVYYKPGSLKATNCRAGRAALLDFCETEGVPYDLCGKVIVAVTEGERPRLQAIFERGTANGVACELIGPERLRELEPHVAGVAAIHVPDAGIADYPALGRCLAERAQEQGLDLRLSHAVTGIASHSDSVTVETTQGAVTAKTLVACAGLHADRLARMAGLNPDVQIVPFRGEYLELRPEAEHLCRTLIYPVPDPAFPFLGVHFTRMVRGGVECGPNAVLALAREGYDWGTLHLGDLAETLGYRGFRRLALQHWRMGLYEMHRSLSRSAFLKSLQRLVPEVTRADLRDGGAGVRAQAVTRDGALADDFVIHATDRQVHVLNAPSPAATASLAIGARIAAQVGERSGDVRMTAIGG
ncbi:MAG: L-2-hydroxyglutarate oxidase [Bacteroidota bacterium]